jgi:RelE toxin of RelEB toxin-antitoxin system
MQTRPITVAETAAFLRQAAVIWSDDEHSTFVNFIVHNPESGDVIPESGGVRKIRWRRRGSGKRGGVRVIYFHGGGDIPLYLLMIYAKARRDDLSPDAKRAVQALAARLRNAQRR